MRQQPLFALNDDEFDLPEIDARIVLHDRVKKAAQLAGGLHAGKPAADDDESQQPIPLDEILGLGGNLYRADNATTDFLCVRYRT